MAAGQRVKLCDSDSLRDGGEGLRFEVKRGGQACAAFAIRHEGRVYAYLNRCAHIGVELDWQPGRFFDADRQLIVCSTHGALYRPDSGKCIEGPCRGESLTPLALSEEDGYVYFFEVMN
ncbi:MAG TPA: Rieske (2Fe-2S) protein [Burkholderiales bacterium]|nr:Rieske (2Fe-2S) protein [Burkholderiales bacterium]